MKSSKPILILLAALLPLGMAQASTLVLTVNTTADIVDASPGDGVCQTVTPGQCTLRAAIQEAVASINAPNVITAAEILFSIPNTDPGRVTGTHTGSGLAYEYYRIEITQPLPAIGAPHVLIDATGQPATNPLGVPKVLLRGSSTAAVQGSGGLRAAQGFITIRGFALQGFGRALAITPFGSAITADTVRLERNWVGIPLPGSEAGHANVEGIVVAPGGGATVTRSTIGGSSGAEGNWIGGNTAGGVIIYGRSSNNPVNVVSQFNVFGNRIGLDPLSGNALGNGGVGLFIRHAAVAVGGLTPERANVIAGSVPGTIQVQTGLGPIENIPIEGVGVFWHEGAVGSMAGNLVGTRPAGDQARPNASDGVRVLRTAGALDIGGSANVISGNGGHGIALIGAFGSVTSGIVIDGNRIGVVAGGNAALPNQGAGVFIGEMLGTLPVRIGSAGTGNVIAGNGGDGIRIQNLQIAQIEVLGNRIGLGANGITPLPNLGWGIGLSGAGTSGGALEPAARIEGNTISSNALGGLLVAAPQSSMLVELCANRIGLAVDGVTPRGNQGPGLRLQNASVTGSGGLLRQAPDCAVPDLIAHNAGPGVTLAANAVHVVANLSRMRFRDNDADENALAIDLGDDGPTPNDPNDVDNGPNRLQNFPDLGAVVLNGVGDELSVSFRVDTLSTAFYPIRVDFYLDDGQGQGLDRIGHVHYEAADAQSLVTVTLPATPDFAGRGLVALATAADQRSSEFSRPRVVIGTTPMRNLLIDRAGAGSGTVDLDPPGNTCAPPCLASYPEGTTVLLTAVAAPGSAFGNWFGSCVGNVPTCTLIMSQDRAVTAQFDPAPSSQPLTVNIEGQGAVVSDPAGIACPGTCVADFAHGSTVTLNATAAAGWLFDGWAGCTPTGIGGQCSLTLTAPASVTAFFVRPATEIMVEFSGGGEGGVTSSPAGLDCFSGGPACFGTWDADEGPITLSASPSAGSVFLGWSGACTGTGTCVLGPSGDFQVTARFEPEGMLPEDIFEDGFEGTP
jgi:CSLREA domain-containing protein